MGVELLPCPYVLGSRISSKTLGGSKQELPTNITYGDNKERTIPLRPLPPDDASSHSSCMALDHRYKDYYRDQTLSTIPNHSHPHKEYPVYQHNHSESVSTF
jgi:hypothetical protein